MLEYALEAVRGVEESVRETTLRGVLPALRARLGLDNFGELLLGMPSPDFPRLSRALPRMASTEVQELWTGNSGMTLLRQSLSFVRSAVFAYAQLTGRGLRGCSVLDFGCGYGRLARLMYYFVDAANLFGVDPWDRSIEVCRQDGFGANFRQSDYLPKQLPVDERTFELIYAFSVFTHLSPRAATTALRTLRRYVGDRGVLVITIRPVEFWLLGPGVHQERPVAHLPTMHRRDGFAFVPHQRAPVDGDINYGDASMTPAWIEANAPGWSVAGIDRSMDDPYQVYVFLRPC